jgi:hypothetical protein
VIVSILAVTAVASLTKTSRDASGAAA